MMSLLVSLIGLYKIFCSAHVHILYNGKNVYWDVVENHFMPFFHILREGIDKMSSYDFIYEAPKVSWETNKHKPRNIDIPSLKVYVT